MQYRVKGRYKYTYTVKETGHFYIDEVVEADSKAEAIEAALSKNDDLFFDAGEFEDGDAADLQVTEQDGLVQIPESVLLMRLGPSVAPPLLPEFV